MLRERKSTWHIRIQTRPSRNQPTLKSTAAGLSAKKMDPPAETDLLAAFCASKKLMQDLKV